MTGFMLAVLLGALVAAPDDSAVPAGAELKIWAVEAHSEGRKEPYFERGLEEVREAVTDGKHDTYVKLKSAKHGFKDDEPVRTELTEQYTLSASPPTAAEDGRYRVKLRLTMKQEKKKSTNPLQPDSLLPPNNTRVNAREIEALSSELLLQPGKQVVVRGLKLEDGREMVLVVTLSVPPKSGDKR